MPATSFLTAFIALLSAPIGLASVDTGEPARCSVDPFGGGGASAILLGTARNDTVEAGAGAVAPRERFQTMRQGAERHRVGGRYAPARFRVDDDGTMRVEQRIELSDGRSVVVRGERASSEVIACDG